MLFPEINEPRDNIYGPSEKISSILFAFFFVLFFVQFGIKMLLNEEINSYETIVTTVLITTWYGLSLMMSQG
jgi:hypothetical protein